MLASLVDWLSRKEKQSQPSSRTTYLITTTMISSPIAKTALDALHAKYSALLHYPKDMVSSNPEIYTEYMQRVLLHDEDTGKGKRRPQTPLVNLGYAIRVHCISKSIESFIKFHKYRQQDQKKQRAIQLVLLGCGMDVIGIWAASLLDDSACCQLNVIEMDQPEICQAKKEIFMKQNIIDPTARGNMVTPLEHEHIVLKGRIRQSSEGKETRQSQTSSTHTNYTLLQVDLADSTQVRTSLSKSTDSNTPTLIISELVVSYLSESSCRKLLEYCATGICQAENSALVALEPLGASARKNNNSSELCSVVEGYKRSYCGKFGTKLIKGTASDDTKGNRPAAPFRTLGNSCDHCEALFRGVGLQHAHSASLLEFLASAVESFAIQEMFDEHAAMSLHLQSYAITIGLSNGSDGGLQRSLCPWIQLDNGVSFSVIQRQDEFAVRKLFISMYEDVFDEHPAVRKMCRTALKSDLAQTSHPSDSQSTIAMKYEALGGCFIVATTNERSTGGERRRVVGIGGIRRIDEYRGRGDDKNIMKPTIEINRLCVHKEFRGQRIGQAIVKLLESHAKERNHTCVLATTIDILEAANKFYRSCGYELQNESKIGKLLMRDFIKTLS